MTALLASGDEAAWAFVLRKTEEGTAFVSQRALQLREAQREFIQEVMASPEGKQMAKDKVRDVRHALADAQDWERDDLLRELRRWKLHASSEPTHAKFDLERLKEIPIQDVMPSQPVSRHGDRLVYLCSLHNERTGSFTLFTKDNHWYCFGCSQGGDVVDFIQAYEHVDFVGACRILSKNL